MYIKTLDGVYHQFDRFSLATKDIEQMAKEILDVENTEGSMSIFLEKDDGTLMPLRIDWNDRIVRPNTVFVVVFTPTVRDDEILNHQFKSKKTRKSKSKKTRKSKSKKTRKSKK